MRIRSRSIACRMAAALFVTTLASAQSSAPAVEEALEKGRQQLQQHEYFEALKTYQRANALAGGRSAEASLGMAQATYGMKVFKNSLDQCQATIDLAQGNARLLTRAHKLKGQVYETTGDLPNAEAEFRAAIASNPNESIGDLHYALGLVLIAQHRDEEGIVELKKEIELRPNGTTAEEARAVIENPRRGRESYAPAFSVTSASGELISLEALHGKVVLIDFWASWCGPCVRALPSVKKIQKDHARDPFVVVGISHDREERAWRTFMNKNGMTWPQYWDKDGQLGRLFEVQAIPTYVLLDPEGIVRMRVKGTGFDSARALVAEIDKQVNLARNSVRGQVSAYSTETRLH